MRERQKPSSPGRGPSWLVEPDVEERVQLLAALALCETDEVGRGDVLVAVLSAPCAQDREERGVTDLLAEGLQGHGATVIDRRGEQRLRSRQSRGSGEPQLLPLFAVLIDGVE